jgi:hypothetical protein
MKKLILLLLPLTLLLTACPVGMDYSLGNLKENIDQNLIGTWEVETESSEIKKVQFLKDSKSSLRVKILERGEMYALETDDLTAYQTVLEGKTFLILKPDGEEKFYHYQYEMVEGKIVFHDVSLMVKGMDGVTSMEAFRTEVAASMKMENYGTEKTILKRVEE